MVEKEILLLGVSLWGVVLFRLCFDSMLDLLCLVIIEQDIDVDNVCINNETRMR